MLLRFDPFREVDRLTEHAWGGLRSRLPVMPLDAYRSDDDLVAYFDLPGVDPSTIDVTVEKNVLTIKAERKPERSDGAEVLVSERAHGSFSRQLFLGESLDGERVRADYEAGVLTVTIPVAEKALVRKVEVTTGSDAAGSVEAPSKVA